MTSVISVKGKINIWGPSLENAPNDVVYIGRAIFMGGWKLRKSIFANPFKVDKYNKKNGVTIEHHGTLDDVCERYKEYVLSKPELLRQIGSLKGKKLACWCYPNRCHGDVLKELAENEELVVKRLEELENKREMKDLVLIIVDSDGKEIETI